MLLLADLYRTLLKQERSSTDSSRDREREREREKVVIKYVGQVGGERLKKMVKGKKCSKTTARRNDGKERERAGTADDSLVSCQLLLTPSLPLTERVWQIYP